MEQTIIYEAMDRIGQMETYFDALRNAVNANPAALRKDDFLKEAQRILTGYYEGGQWLRDYEMDEKGLLPENMKRGVLSQDAVYDLLERIKDIG